MIEISVRKPKSNLARELHRQMPYATAMALTRVGKEVQARTVDAMRSRLDRPTPFALNSIFVTPAKKGAPETTIGLKDSNYNKVSQTSATIFGHLFSGGQRRYKRIEGALRRKGLLSGDMIAVPGSGATLDGYGNLTSGQIVRLMSVIGLFGEQGYSANATPAKLKRMARRSKSGDGFARINGVVYFVSRGRGTWTGAGAWKHGRSQNLAAGIWAKSGTHGVSVKPILMFVRVGIYRQFINLPQIAQATVAERFDPEFSAALDRAIGGAR